MYGSTMNWSLTENDGQYELGLRYKDSNGIDIDHQIEDDDLSSLVKKVYKDFSKDYIKQAKVLKAAAAEKAKKEAEKKSELEDSKPESMEDKGYNELRAKIRQLEQENNALKINNKILQRRADDAVNEQLNKKKSNAPFDIEDPFEDLTSIFEKFFY